MSRMMLLAVLMGAMLGFASPAFADPAEDNAVKFVEKLGGTIQRDTKSKAKVKPVTGVFLSKSEITDKGLQTLGGIKTLEVLDLGNASKVTDAGMKQIAALKTVTDLRLEKVGLTDAGLKDLAALDLVNLDLNGTSVTDAGVKELAGLKSLKKLQLTNTRITDAGLKELAAIASLTFLDLSGSSITANGIKDFKKANAKCKILGP